MQIRKLSGMGLLLLLIVGIFWALYYPTVADRHSPQAAGGELDLGGWDFKRNGLADLDGEWAFYPGRLLEPGQFSVAPGGYLQVPGTWRGAGKSGDGMARKGFGTYRLVIHMQPTDEIYGVKVTSIRMGHRLYIDGRLAGQSGRPADDRLDSRPGNTPYTAFFQPRGRDVEIVLQVANFEFVTGGVVNSLQFGLSADLIKLNGIRIGTDIAICLILVILGAYHISVYILERRDKTYLILGLYLLLLGVQMSIYGEKIIQRLLPGLPFDLVYKGLEIFQFAGVILIMQLFYIVERRLFKLWTRRLLALPFMIYIAAVALLPYRIHIDYKYIFVLYEGFAVLVLVGRLLHLFARTKVDAKERFERFLLLGSLVMLLLFLIGISLYAENALSSDLVAKSALLGFILCLQLLLAVRFSNEFAKTASLSHQLTVSNQLKDEFLVHTSHELKTPLNGIMNMVSHLLEDGERTMATEQRQNLWLVKDTASKLSMLIKDLIDVVHLKHGELRLYSSVVDMRVAVQIVFDMLRFELSGKQVVLNNAVEADVWVTADESRLRQVLYNLVHNAIKHTQHGEIRVRADRGQAYIAVFVEDTGTGVPPEKRESLFGEFDSIDRSVPRDGYEGMGVGLYISRKLIERMGGQIGLDWTEPGTGTRMKFTLPGFRRMPGDLEIAAGAEQSKRVSQEDGSLDRWDGNAHTVLIVDDEASNVLTLRQMLRRSKFNVVTAFSAGEAALKLQQFPHIDLAVVDIMMPGTSGIELCRTIRESRSILDLPILISTVKDSHGDIALGFEAGANDYVTKPFEGETLIARIRTLISMRSAIREAMRNEQAFHQAQIKPHFLYNALSSVIGFCYTDGEKAAELLSVLSQYIRHILETDRDKPLVPLHRELEVIEAYVKIEQARFGERFDFICEIEEEAQQCEVPSLSVQPFVENAIRHGLFEKEGLGAVSLTARIERSQAVIVIKDDGVGIPSDVLRRIAAGERSEDRDGGIGIANIRKRLDAMPGAALRIRSEPGEGTEVSIHLPYER